MACSTLLGANRLRRCRMLRFPIQKRTLCSEFNFRTEQLISETADCRRKGEDLASAEPLLWQMSSDTLVCAKVIADSLGLHRLGVGMCFS